MSLPKIVNEIEYQSDKSTLFSNDVVMNKNFTVKGNTFFGDNASQDKMSITGEIKALNGHIFLEGSVANSSTGNTTQIIFGKPATQHIAISSNDKALIINPNSSETQNQIVLYLNTHSKFPSGIFASDIITNSMTINDGSINLQGNDKDQFINFTYTGPEQGYDWRVGHLGTGSGDTNYFVIQSNKTTSTWTNALRIGLTSLNIQVGGSLYPTGNGTQDLGLSTLKWNNIYANNLYQNGKKTIDSAGGTVNKIPKFTATNTIGDSNLIDNGTEISASSKFSITGGLKVSGRYAGGGDDEGIVVYPANNQYASICLGEPTGKRTVLYLMPEGTSVWRWCDGTSIHNLYHPGVSGRVLALPSAGTTNKLLKFTGNYQANSSNITDDGSTITLGSKVVVQGNGGSYNEGIRILPASNGWSNIFFSGDTSTSGTHSGGWLIGRRGAAGNFAGDIGDFTIENDESNGNGLTLHKNGNMTLRGNTINIAKKVQLFYNSSDKSLDFIFN